MIRKSNQFKMVKLVLGIVAAGMIFLSSMSGSEVRGAAKFDGVYVIVSQRSGLALDIWRGSPYNEANIIQWYRHDGTNQQWLIKPSIYEEGYYTITSVKNVGKSFDVYKGSKAIATRIIQYDSLPWQNNQKWRIMEHSDGTVTFMALDAINAKTNYVLDVNGGSTSPDTNIIQYPYMEGNTNQRWYLVPYNQITMTFQSNGGAAVAPVVLGEAGLAQKPADPFRRGFSFAGWFKDEALTQEWNFAVDLLKESTTVYAKWSALTEATITYNSMGGSAVAPATEYIGQAAVKPADPVLSGYRFAGWYKDEALMDDWDFTADIVAGSMMLYARWEEVALIPDGIYYIKSEAAGTYLDMTNYDSNIYHYLTADASAHYTTSPFSGLPVFLRSIPTLANQRQTLEMEVYYDPALGLYQITPVTSGKPLTITGADGSEGKLIVQWYFAGEQYEEQYWSVESAGTGFKFVNAATGKAMDVSGQNLVQSTSDARATEVFSLTKIRDIPNSDTNTPGIAGKVIWLDPGHGSTYWNSIYSATAFDPGAVQLGDSEYVYTMAYANALAAQLRGLGATVYISGVDSPTGVFDSQAASLRARAWHANAVNADLFISLHHNSSTSSTASGAITFYYTRDSYMLTQGGDPFYTTADPRISGSMSLQQTLQPSSAPSAYGVFQNDLFNGADGNYSVIRNPAMPAVLLELGFLSNSGDNALITDNAPNATIVNSIRDGLVNYFNTTAGWQYNSYR